LSLAISTLALTPPVEARPQQPSLGICDFDELADVANLGDAGSALAVVADAGANRMFILGAGGCDDFPLMDGGNPAEFNGPRGVTADPDGRIYVADTGNDRIMRFEGVAGLNSTDGVNLLDVFDGSTVGLNLDAPEGLGADDDGLIYIANTGAGRVRIIDSAGFSQGLIGSPDDGDDETDGEFLEPADVADAHPRPRIRMPAGFS
jgi:hypothetical protein